MRLECKRPLTSSLPALSCKRWCKQIPEMVLRVAAGSLSADPTPCFPWQDYVRDRCLQPPRRLMVNNVPLSFPRGANVHPTQSSKPSWPESAGTIRSGRSTSATTTERGSSRWKAPRLHPWCEVMAPGSPNPLDEPWLRFRSPPGSWRRLWSTAGGAASRRSTETGRSGQTRTRCRALACSGARRGKSFRLPTRRIGARWRWRLVGDNQLAVTFSREATRRPR